MHGTAIYICILSFLFFCSGFSYVDLVECRRDRKTYALKRVLCHSKRDEQKFLKEVDYMKEFASHSNIIDLVGSEVSPVNNPTSSVTSKILILMPYYPVSS